MTAARLASACSRSLGARVRYRCSMTSIKSPSTIGPSPVWSGASTLRYQSRNSLARVLPSRMLPAGIVGISFPLSGVADAHVAGGRAAFAGLERMHAAYAHAIARGYRFYSYGDGSLLHRNETA